jgi:hypothetical protein
MSALTLGMGGGVLGAFSMAGGAGFAGGGGGLAGGALEGAGRVLDFRRRGAPPRRRRRNPLLALVRPLGVAVTAVALPLALAGWVLTSPRFQLRHVEVVAAAAAPAASAAPAAVAVSAALAAPHPAAGRARRAAAALLPSPSLPSLPSLPPSPPSPPSPAETPSSRARPAAPPAAAPLEPAGRVPAAWVQQALAPLAGRNLLRLPLAEVRQRLAANPWIAAVDVAKQLPDRLRVRIAERRPAVLLRSGEALLYADAAGRPIAPVESPAAAAAARRQELLVVTLPPPFAGTAPPLGTQPRGDSAPGTAAATAAAGEREGEARIAGALLLAARLRELRPAWSRSLSRIDVVDEDDYQLHVEGLPCPLLVRGSHLAGNLGRLEQLLPELRRRYPALASVDLRFSRRIVIQPAIAGPKSETQHRTSGNP